MAKSYKSLRAEFDALPEASRAYLGKMDVLLDGSDKYDIALAYSFMKLEEGNHRALKCGLVRLHKLSSSKVDDALQKQHFTRSYYQTVYKTVLGESIPKPASAALKQAEAIRDKLIHGKAVQNGELRQAVSDTLKYVSVLGEAVEAKTGKNPFGDLRGLAGKAKTLDNVVSYWVLKGMGFYNQKESAGGSA